MKNAETIMIRIKHKSEQIYKKFEKEVRKMKQSCSLIEDDIKKALEEKNNKVTEHKGIL